MELEAGLEDLDFGPTEGLLPPLARARNKFTSEYDRTMETLRTAVTSVTAVNSFLEGPTRYLVLAGNNSEMRAGSGMFLQVGTLQVDQGRFELSKLTPAGDLLLEQPGGTLDPDVQQLWDWLLPNREWRNLNVTPRFDESARMATEMWATAGRKDVDGVLMIDVLGLQRLLEIVGPVDVAQDDGTMRTVSADTVRQELLLDQYIEFGDDRDQRREQPGRVGTAVFESFNQRSSPPRSCCRRWRTPAPAATSCCGRTTRSSRRAGRPWGLGQAPGRRDPAQRAQSRRQQAGPVPAGHRGHVGGDHRASSPQVTVKVTMANDTPPGLPTYVAGPYPGTTYSAGQYIGILALTVPGGTGDPAVSGGELYVSGQDGPTRVLSSKVDIQPGASARSRSSTTSRCRGPRSRSSRRPGTRRSPGPPGTRRGTTPNRRRWLSTRCPDRPSDLPEPGRTYRFPAAGAVVPFRHGTGITHSTHRSDSRCGVGLPLLLRRRRTGQQRWVHGVRGRRDREPHPDAHSHAGRGCRQHVGHPAGRVQLARLHRE